MYHAEEEIHYIHCFGFDSTIQQQTIMAEEEVTALCHILVIGGCGFLGHHIVKAFLDHPSHPTISVISRSPTHNFLEGANYYPCDISDQSALDSIFSTLKPTIVVNTASPLANAGAKVRRLAP